MKAALFLLDRLPVPYLRAADVLMRANLDHNTKRRLAFVHQNAFHLR